MSNSQFWEENAGPWSDSIRDGLIASRATTNPALVKMILDQKSKSVLDVGCGDGWLYEQLRAQKDLHYFGMDGSEALIEIAKQKGETSFAHVSYETLVTTPWPSRKSFDLIVFNFSIFEKNPSPLLVAMVKFLREGGQILIQTLHPCFALKKYEDRWQVDEFKTIPKDFKGQMDWYARTLSSWSKIFANAGLSIREIREPQLSEKPASILFLLGPRI